MYYQSALFGLWTNPYSCKTSIIGINLNIEEVEVLTSRFGCKAESLSFVYLAFPVGGKDMAKEAWKRNS